MRKNLALLAIAACACGSGHGGGGGGGSGVGGNGSGGFPAAATFYQDISGAPADALAVAFSGHFGIDFSFAILAADGGVARRPFTQPPDAQPDCDTAPIPVPASGHIEGNPSYACADGGDCHLLVYQGARLYELYQANISGGSASGGSFSGGCLVVWDLGRDYWSPSTTGAGYARGDGCNGADAADLPIAPLILRTDELSAGVVAHALRFTLPNSQIRAGVYVHPATHIGGPSGGAAALPYGARLRLKQGFDESKLPSDAARVVARALKKYGMFLADGGNPYISATDDAASAIAGDALGALGPSDFEMVEGGARLDWRSFNCTRTPIAQ